MPQFQSVTVSYLNKLFVMRWRKSSFSVSLKAIESQAKSWTSVCKETNKNSHKFPNLFPPYFCPKFRINWLNCVSVFFCSEKLSFWWSKLLLFLEIFLVQLHYNFAILFLLSAVEVSSISAFFKGKVSMTLWNNFYDNFLLSGDFPCFSFFCCRDR